VLNEHGELDEVFDLISGWLVDQPDLTGREIMAMLWAAVGEAAE
jgi:hypothetical protein